MQQSAWRLQLPVLRAALEDLQKVPATICRSPKAIRPRPEAGVLRQMVAGTFLDPAPWIHLEFDIPRLGRRVDAVLVTQKCVIPIEFKVGAKRFEWLDYEQPWDCRINLKTFHAPSPDLGVP